MFLDSEDSCGIDKVLLYFSYFDVRAGYFGEEEEEEGLGIGWCRLGVGGRGVNE